MANSKGETSGKVLEFVDSDGHQMRLCVEIWSDYGRDPVWAHGPQVTADHVAAALLANPEARMAVLAHFWSPEECASVEKRAAELWQAIGEPDLRNKLSEAEARLPHLEEAAELLRRVVTDSPNGPWRECGDWFRRDQAISAPTAANCPRCEEPLPTACDGEGCPMGEPGPTAESGKDHSASAQKEDDDDRKRNDRDATAKQRETGDAGLVRDEADSPRDDRCAEGGAEEPRASTGHHKVGGSATLGRRSDDGRVAELEAKVAELEQERADLHGALAWEEAWDMHTKADAANLACVILNNADRSDEGPDWHSEAYILAERILNRDPAPVAEAPERVTHGEARDCISGMAEASGWMAVGRKLTRYADQQEQLEREVAELRKELEQTKSARDALSESLNRVVARNAKLTDDLRAKLSESERKLGLLADAGGMVYDQLMLWHGSDDWEPGDEQAASGWLVALRGEPAAKEPTGREPAKAKCFCVGTRDADQHERSCPMNPSSTPPTAEAPQRHELNEHTWCTRCDRFDPGGPCPGKPSKEPPAAEAEPRFRVGQRVRITGYEGSKIPACCKGETASVLYIPDPGTDPPGCTVAMERAVDCWKAGEQWWVDFSELEPTDPAPPRPGGDRPVMMGELVTALETSGNEAMKWLARELRGLGSGS